MPGSAQLRRRISLLAAAALAALLALALVGAPAANAQEPDDLRQIPGIGDPLADVIGEIVGGGDGDEDGDENGDPTPPPADDPAPDPEPAPTDPEAAPTTSLPQTGGGAAAAGLSLLGLGAYGLRRAFLR